MVCGRVERDSEDTNAINNPVVLVEILSPSTEDYDRGEKLEHYKQLEALREVVFVAHAERRVDVVRRQADGGWVTLSVKSGESIRLEAIDCTLAVDAVYRDPLAQ